MNPEPEPGRTVRNADVLVALFGYFLLLFYSCNSWPALLSILPRKMTSYLVCLFVAMSTALFYVGWPLIHSIFRRWDPMEKLAGRMPTKNTMLVAIAVAPAAWLAFEIVPHLERALLADSLSFLDSLRAPLLLFLTEQGRPEPISPSGGLFIMLLLFALLPAIYEELFFRGYLQSMFKKYGTAVAVVAPSLLFAFCHFRSYQFITLTLFGIVLGLVRHYTKTTFATMIVHFVNNAAIGILGHFGIHLFR